jgi:hypothetical protein
MKNERSNLNIMKILLKLIVNFETLGMVESFQGTCFGHAFPKACQYGIIE